jgi:Amidase
LSPAGSFFVTPCEPSNAYSCHHRLASRICSLRNPSSIFIGDEKSSLHHQAPRRFSLDLRQHDSQASVRCPDDSVELRELLAAGSITSVDIIEAFLGQIERHNVDGLKLNAMITTTPKDLVLAIARERDHERSQGIIRGPLHGIPITVKVPPTLPVSLEGTPNSSY